MQGEIQSSLALCRTEATKRERCTDARRRRRRRAGPSSRRKIQKMPRARGVASTRAACSRSAPDLHVVSSLLSGIVRRQGASTEMPVSGALLLLAAVVGVLSSPPVPCGTACLPNGAMGLPAATDPTKPLSWSNYTWSNSSFSWEVPACAGATTKALRVTGGMGTWGAPVNLSSAPADVRQASGDLMVRVNITYLAKDVRPGSQLVVYFTGAHVSASGGIAGWTTHELQRLGDGCTVAQSLSVGDIRLPATLEQPMHLALNLRMNDGPMTTATELPTSVWFTSADILFVANKAPTGMAESVGQVGDQVDVWAEHASHKVFPAAVPPPIPTRLTSVAPIVVTMPPMMRGGSTSLQLALRVRPTPGTRRTKKKRHEQKTTRGVHDHDEMGIILPPQRVATPVECFLSWSSDDNLTAGLVLAVNISQPSGTYPLRPMTPIILLATHPICIGIPYCSNVPEQVRRGGLAPRPDRSTSLWSTVSSQSWIRPAGPADNADDRVSGITGGIRNRQL